MLPTPVVNDMGAGKTVERWDEWTAKTKAKHNNGNGHGASLSIELLRFSPEGVIDETVSNTDNERL
jgi:DNA (cytosine-5)-methyltransferase 1